jgi:RNase adaptor protein for sRNA GlmZ degradation
MAAIAQRIIGAAQKAEGDTGFLSDDEKEQLLSQLEETAKEVVDEQELKVDELTNEIEELKQKVSK